GRIDLEVGPAILEVAEVVVGKRHRLGQVIPVKTGQHAHLYHQLEAVADPQDQLAVLNETGELLHQFFTRAGHGGVFQPVGLGLGAPQVVAIQKSAGQVEEMEVVQPDLAGEDLGDVGDDRLVEAPQAAGVGRLHLAVGAVAGYDDCACLYHDSCSP